MKSLMTFKWGVFFLIIVVSTVCCQSEQNSIEDLIGHWHLKKSDIEIMNYYHILDIKNDSLAKFDGIKLNYFRYRNIEDNNSNFEYKLALVSEGIYEEYNYVLSKDSLILYDNEGNLEYVGIRKNIESCSKTIDFYSTQLVSIDLPSKKINENIVEMEIPYALKIYFGIDKTFDVPIIQFENRILVNDRIELEIDKFLAKIPPELQSNINLIVSIDDKFDRNRYTQFIESLDLIRFNEVYQYKLDKSDNIVIVKYETLN